MIDGWLYYGSVLKDSFGPDPANELRPDDINLCWFQTTWLVYALGGEALADLLCLEDPELLKYRRFGERTLLDKIKEYRSMVFVMERLRLTEYRKDDRHRWYILASREVKP